MTVLDTAVLRIAVVGAECTGKSTLCAALAADLPGIAVPEALRLFGERCGRTPQAHEQASVVAQQIALEQEGVRRARAAGHRWVICDSTPLATALYSIDLFGDTALLEDAIAHQRGYALTLFAAPDLPWEADGIQRDGPDARTRFDALLRATLARHGVGHVPVEGPHAARIERALSACRSAYNRGSR